MRYTSCKKIISVIVLLILWRLIWIVNLQRCREVSIQRLGWFRTSWCSVSLLWLFMWWRNVTWFCWSWTRFSISVRRTLIGFIVRAWARRTAVVSFSFRAVLLALRFLFFVLLFVPVLSFFVTRRTFIYIFIGRVCVLRASIGLFISRISVQERNKHKVFWAN